MKYIFIDKKNNYKVSLYNSIKALERNKNISKNTLYYHFTRLKKDIFENDLFKILKRDIIK